MATLIPKPTKTAPPGQGDVMAKLNEAQQLREALGIETPPVGVGELRASATKRGPGRVHESGLKRDKPIKARPPLGFEQHTNPKRNHERRIVKAWGGFRAYKRGMRQPTGLAI